MVDVLDRLFAPVAFDIDVDVRRPVPLGRQEPLEQKAEPDSVGLCYPERIANSRIGGRSPALAKDVRFVAKTHDVPDDEEITGETELVDHVQFVIDLGVRTGMFRGAARPVAALRTLFCEVAKPRHLCVRGRGGERRELRCDQFQVEGARQAELGCPLDRSWVTGKAAGLLGPAAQVGTGRRW